MSVVATAESAERRALAERNVDGEARGRDAEPEYNRSLVAHMRRCRQLSRRASRTMSFLPVWTKSPVRLTRRKSRMR
jgi:hypothetical protein